VIPSPGLLVGGARRADHGGMANPRHREGKSKLLLLSVALLVIGASLSVAFGSLGGESSPAREETSSPTSPAKVRLATPLSDTPQQGCTNLKLTPSARAELEQVPVKGSTYYGACNGHRWWMTRFPDGSDGVFKDRSSTVVRIGSIAEARCKVPHGLLKIWLQADDCLAASSDPSSDPDEPQSTVKRPDPTHRSSPQNECKPAVVPVPNYDPTDSVPDQRLPRPEELLPPRSECPELYEGQQSNPQPDGQRRYPNGRTWIEQYNWCQIMRDQGVACAVPPPP
jgi:hypothetical protein